MGLDQDFLSMLTASATCAPYTGDDEWGNATYGVIFTFRCVVEPTNTTYGATDGNDKADPTTVNSTSITCDALGLKIGDMIELPNGMIGFVAQAQTARDETGADLYQTISVENTERG